MRSSSGLFHYSTMKILDVLRNTPNQRYMQLKDKLSISDATLSDKMKLLRQHELITPNVIGNEVGRNYITYSLTTKGKSLSDVIKNYFKCVEDIEK